MKDQINKKLIKLTSRLIRFKSTNDNYAQRLAVINFVEKQFSGERVFIRRYERLKVPSIVITLHKENNPKVILNGHLDVVPAENNLYTPLIKDGKIYGRGSGDMKAGCAVMIEVIRYFSRQKNPPSLGLMLTTDEEVGGRNGVGYLVEEKKYRPELVIIPDGGIDLKTIVTHQKGILHLKVKASGKSAHGSRPFLGENAVDKLIYSYQRLKKVIPDLTAREWKNTMNLGKINGGETINRVPHRAEMFLDVRYTQSSDRQRLLERIGAIVEEFEIISEGNPLVQKNNHEHIVSYTKIVEEQLEEKITTYRVEGASDGRYFSQHQIPAIITKISCGNIHGEKEWVDISEMENFYHILVKFLNQLRVEKQ